MRVTCVRYNLKVEKCDPILELAKEYTRFQIYHYVYCVCDSIMRYTGFKTNVQNVCIYQMGKVMKQSKFSFLQSNKYTKMIILKLKMI